MQDGAWRDSRGKQTVMMTSTPIRNLLADSNGCYWLIDNECALLDAYALLFTRGVEGLRFHEFHRRTLHNLCIFNRRLVDRLRWLAAAQPSPAAHLLSVVSGCEPRVNIPRDTRLQLFLAHFSERLYDVLLWVEHCQTVQ